jgi:VanZ family protein
MVEQGADSFWSASSSFEAQEQLGSDTMKNLITLRALCHGKGIVRLVGGCEVGAIKQLFTPSSVCGVESSVYRVLFIVIAIIAYGSLYPFDFHSVRLPASPPWVLIHSWPRAIDRFLIRDTAVNLLIYMPLGVFGFLTFHQNLRTTLAVLATIMIGLVLSSSIEMIQLFDDARECSALDVVCNVTGTGTGVALGTLYQRWLKQTISRIETASSLHPSGAVLLVCAWLAYQVFPLFPTLSRTRLAEKLHGLFASVTLSPLDAITCFVEWLVLAQLLMAMLGTEGIRRLLLLLPLVLPARLFLAGRSFTWSELAGAMLACVCAYVLSAYRWRLGLSAVLIVSILILRGLAPYHWSSVANRFSWIPFSGFLEANREFSMLTFLRKCFWYGSTIWLLRTLGWRLTTAAVAVALLLAAIEVVQIHLPGRVAEITDPVLALILAATLGLLDRRQDL